MQSTHARRTLSLASVPPLTTRRHPSCARRGNGGAGEDTALREGGIARDGAELDPDIVSGRRTVALEEEVHLVELSAEPGSEGLRFVVSASGIGADAVATSQRTGLGLIEGACEGRARHEGDGRRA